MSIFNQKSRFKNKTPLRTVKVTVETTPKPKPKPTPPTSAPSRADSPATNGSSSRSLTKKRSSSYLDPNPDVSSSTSSYTKKRQRGSARGSKSPLAQQNPASPFAGMESDSDPDSDNNSWEDSLDPRKRMKRAHAQTRQDPNRRVKHPKLWTGGREGEGEALPIKHAVEVASLKEKCQPVMKLSKDEVAVRLRYPGSNYRERYELVSGKDKIDGPADIMSVVQHVASIYLTEAESEEFLDQNSGIYRRLEKSKNTNDGAGFKVALLEYNQKLLDLQRKGAIAKNLATMRGVPHELVAFILTQIYDRIVAPKVELLAKYENGSDNVYGELLPPFVANIFERTKLTSDMVFVDLGSGVGNVVLQAALEIGCESWGCEMMENACNLADGQKKEFSARCRMWGIAPGKVYLERGDFRKNDKILEALKRADVVLVNNQAFTSVLNDHLVNMFLDLKIGCRIVSLKTFVHDNKIAENDVASSILDVEHLTYPENYVSWTGAPGTFCISKRK
ncbi:putative histone-lysine N-methyltransferase, H3 lysine-79 specific [Podospora australis]|uniref:Histone-lysine N-methyltransferase, H3 lysine-79 specific n=1 Tax=Podospora australis TaxID=1536484 RepID=A0AAN6WR90_9PEZI|nr:putative histone-lysine N-methyltransferase, H3 lysine-79 specific [Podospora australis]